MRKPPPRKPIPKDKLAIDKIVDDASRDIQDDQAHLYDFFMYCRRSRPDYFHSWTIEQFREWNDARLAMIDNHASAMDAYYAVPPEGAKSPEYRARKRFDYTGDPEDIPTNATTEQVRAKLHRANGNRTWNADTRTLENDPKTPHLDA